MGHISIECLRNNTIFKKLFKNIDSLILDITIKWKEPHRYYHSLDNHLIPLFNLIQKLEVDGTLAKEDVELLYIIAVFHDIVYKANLKNNEVESANLFKNLVGDRRCKEIDIIYRAILSTKEYLNPRYRFTDLEMLFMNLDCDTLYNGSLNTLIDNEKLLFKEYQMFPYESYKSGRLEFLDNFKKTNTHRFPKGADVLSDYIDYIKTRIPRIGVYAGSFDPFHKGHKDILRKADMLFDKVVVAMGTNGDKSANKYKYDTYLELVESTYPRQVDIYNGFLSDYIKKQEKFADITLIRGVRTGSDFDYEMNLYKFLQDMHSSIKVLWLPCNREFEHLSSSAVREIARINKNAVKQYI